MASLTEKDVANTTILFVSTQEFVQEHLNKKLNSQTRQPWSLGWWSQLLPVGKLSLGSLKSLSIPDSRCSAACLMATCLLYTACSCFFIHDEGPAGFHALWMLLSHGDRMVNEQTDRNFLMKRMGEFPGEWQGDIIYFWGWT